MKSDDKETLSQLMDGEWHELDPAQSVKSACADEEMKAPWGRYHLIRDVIRQDAVKVDDSLCARISQAIDDEPSYSNVAAINTQHAKTHVSNASLDAGSDTASEAKPAGNQSGWRYGLGGFALAACVALATVFGLNLWQGAPTSNGAASIQTVAAPGVLLPEVELVSNRGTYWVTTEEKRNLSSEQRLNMLLSEHIERSPTAERTGLLPYSRLVGYDSVPADQQ